MNVSRFAAIVALLASAAPALAQEPETRAEALKRAREEKQRQVAPYTPTAIEMTMDMTENKIVPLLQRDGGYAALGSLTTGSGFAWGAGWRDRSLVRGVGSLNLWAAVSLKRYWATEFKVGIPIKPGGVLNLDVFGRLYQYPEEDFFGLGPDARRADFANYNMNGSTLGSHLAFRPVKTLSVGGHLDFLRPRVKSGGSKTLPSVEQLFDVSTLAGWEGEPDYLRTAAFVEVDYRKPLNARKGGWYRVEFSRHDDQNDDQFSFNKVEVDLRQYASILAERRVFAARALVTTTSTSGQSETPFFMLPTLGGNDTLRGFRAFRFRGPHRLLLQAEYRWEIWSAFEAALFWEAGKVALRREDLNFKRLERDYGFGFRFNTDTGVVLRVDAAFGSRDGKHLHIVAGGIF